MPNDPRCLGCGKLPHSGECVVGDDMMLDARDGSLVMGLSAGLHQATLVSIQPPQKMKTSDRKYVKVELKIEVTTLWTFVSGHDPLLHLLYEAQSALVGRSFTVDLANRMYQGQNYPVATFVWDK